MKLRFTVARVFTSKGQLHAELKGDDDRFISFHGAASDNVTKGQEFILQSVEAAKQVLTERDTSHIINLEPENRNIDARKDLL